MADPWERSDPSDPSERLDPWERLDAWERFDPQGAAGAREAVAAEGTAAGRDADGGRAREASGFPSPAMDYEEGRIDLNRELIASPLSTFLMRVRGDAMGADGLCDGDLLVIDRSLNPGPGCVVVALLDGRFIVRRLCLGPGGRHRRPRLEASDGVSPPIPLNDGQGGGADLWGVVRHAVRLLEPRHHGSNRRMGQGISGDGKTEGGGHEPTAPQFPLELGGQAIGPPGPAQLGDQGQTAAKDDQAHQQPQAHFEHGLAD